MSSMVCFVWVTQSFSHSAWVWCFVKPEWWVCTCVFWVGEGREWRRTQSGNWWLTSGEPSDFRLPNPADLADFLGSSESHPWPSWLLFHPRRQDTGRSQDTFPSAICLQQQEAGAGEGGGGSTSLHLNFRPSLYVPHKQQKDLFIIKTLIEDPCLPLPDLSVALGMLFVASNEIPN